MNKNLVLIVSPILSIVSFALMQSAGWSFSASFTAAITFLCASWWVTEAIPISVTSLIPLATFPLVGVLDASQVANAYGSPLILLLMGGFILSTAMERSGAHEQIALRLVNAFGGRSYKHVVFGFMSASALLSMWISNTATTLMLLPIALAVLQYSKNEKLALALMLGICYSASVGGIGTPIGTPPNLIFIKVYEESVGREVTFLEWMYWAVPVVIVLVPIIALWLTRGLKSEEQLVVPASRAWTVEQKRVLLVFGLTALAWITRKEPFGGWSGALELKYANDASVAMLAVVLMFIIPAGSVKEPQRRLLDWESANKIPWGMLFLFAGGIAIAKAFTASGLAAGMSENLSHLAVLPALVMIFLICIAVTFLTEITSNTATTSLLMPVLAIGGAAAGIDPALLMVPAAMSASCAFMLPVATAPNAIVFGSGRVPIQSMLQKGLALNFIGACVVSVVCYLTLSS